MSRDLTLAFDKDHTALSFAEYFLAYNRLLLHRDEYWH